MSSENGTDNTQEIDLVALAKTVWAHRRFIIKLACIGAVIGLIVGFSIPNEYTTVVTMAPEDSKSSMMSGLAALARINIDESTDGVNLDIYPDVVVSTPFLIEMVQMPVPVRDKKGERVMSLYQYIDEEISAPWWSHVLQLPMKALGAVVSVFKDKPELSDGTVFNPKELTQEQEAVLLALKKRIDVTIDNKTKMISASVTMQNAVTSMTVSDSLVNKLQEYVTNYQTDKARRDLKFSERLYNEAQQGYYDAQSKYASYMDATQKSVRESVKAQQERLRNEQQLAYSVYSQLASQLEQAKITLQQKTPIVTIIEPATVPLHKSNMSKLMLLILWTFLGGFAAVGTVIVKDLTNSPNEVKA